MVPAKSQFTQSKNLTAESLMNTFSDLPNVYEFLHTLFQGLHNRDLFPLGLNLTLITMLTIHGMFVLMLTVMFHRIVEKYVKPGAMFMASILYFFVINMIFASHIIDILVWTYITVFLKAVPGTLSAFFFVGEMYTTLGFGQFAIDPAWRSLPILIAISGIFSSAISGAALYSMLNALLVNQKKPMPLPVAKH